MANEAELGRRLEALREIRAQGVLSVSYNGETIVYRSDADIAAAILDMERQLSALVRPSPRIFNIQGRKGYQP